MTYNHILVATGGSEHSQKAEAEALKLALAFGSKLIALATTQTSTAGYTAGVTGEFAQHQQDLERYRYENLERYKQHCEEAGVTVDTVQEIGHAGESVIRVAEEHGCDLIVLGRRRLSLAATVVLGSVSDYVVRHAVCPVLIVQ